MDTSIADLSNLPPVRFVNILLRAIGNGVSMEFPGELQATFVPDEGGFAFWGLAEPVEAVRALGLPEGRAAECALAVPDGDRVGPARVPSRVVELDAALPALRALPEDARLADSLRAWRRAARLLDDDAGDPEFADLAAAMPAAAHAVLDAEQDAIRAPDALLGLLRSSAGLGRALDRAGIHAELRPYQRSGLAWLTGLAGGGVLADEMGLGKTLQAICLLATREDGPHLVVCPTSLLGNWRRELEKFSPRTPVVVHHGPGRELSGELEPSTVVVTGYPVLRTDTAALTGIGWGVLVLDEAQQIKNPTAQATRAAARITARTRIALTGTPVENHLEELWSIVTVTNPGLLGSRARFRERFANPIRQRGSASATNRLRGLLGPHLLRRTKSEVATDLPEKLYATVACTLTGEQARAYTRAVDRAFGDGFGSGIERRGRVLALLTTLKQICNHPVQAGAEDGELTGRSGKLDRATEMLAEIADDGEHALVFTQYREMGELLARHLAGQLGLDTVPFLHGGLPVAQRDRMVERFQHDPDAAPVLLLSLRAAGFGLNLSRANHVLHYDRWWNPAVEEQASDRAHRIGQRRTLTVHTLVTAGTIEDYIARMHESKRALAGVVSGESEVSALAELGDEELHEVLRLDPAGVR